MLFAPEELERVTRPLSSQAEGALEAGNLEQVRFLLGRMSAGHMELYWGYLHWIARILAKIRNDRGNAFLEHLLSTVARFIMRPYISWAEHGDEKRSISALVSLWVLQLGRIELLGETHDEIRFYACPCGSGGRLALESWYEHDPSRYQRTDDGTPLFCRLCEHVQRALHEGLGYTFWSILPDQSRMGCCRMSFFKRTQQGKRLYEGDEIDRIILTRSARALRLLDRGCLSIGGLLKDQHREWRPLHDFLCILVTSMLSLVYKELGLRYLSELVKETYGQLFESAYALYAAIDEKTLVKELARNWYYHQACFTVTEEQDRFVFTLEPCGSGGRLWRGEMEPYGFFRYGDDLLCHIVEASDITFGRTSFPIYCTHCAVTNKDQLVDKPWAFLVDGSAMSEPGRPCRQYLYKKKAARKGPEHLLRQVGLVSVEPLRKEYLL